MTYRTGGKQYVSVIVGMGTSVDVFTKSFGGLTFDNRTQKKRVLTFVLDGQAELPPAPPPFDVKPIADPSYKPDPALAAKGMALFTVHCTLCHGWDAIAGGGAPDLRASPVPQSAEAFAAVVRGGALLQNSMPKFGDFSDADLAAIRQYIRSRAAELRSGK